MVFNHSPVLGCIQTVSSFWLLWTKQLWTTVCLCVHGQMLSFLWDRFSGSYGEYVFNALRNYQIDFQSGYTLSHFHLQQTGFQFLYILTNTGHCLFIALRAGMNNEHIFMNLLALLRIFFRDVCTQICFVHFKLCYLASYYWVARHLSVFYPSIICWKDHAFSKFSELLCEGLVLYFPLILDISHQ